MSMEDNKLLNLMARRRSVRTYTDEPIPDEALEEILSAGLSAPSGKNRRTYEFILVRDKDMLAKLSESTRYSAMIKGADAAIVVFGDSTETYVWTEDCCIATAYMHLMAEYLGVGSCIIQGRDAVDADGRSTEDYLRGLLGVPEQMRLQFLLSLGMPLNHPRPHRIKETDTPKVHREKW